jgi:hypothetical protein
MRKILFIMMFVPSVLPVFVQAEEVYTSEGIYEADIRYIGEYCGQQDINMGIRNKRSDPSNHVVAGVKLNKGQLECVRKLLAKYETSRGDTYHIMIILSRRRFIHIACEFTSDTKWTYWTYEVLH